MSLSVPSLRGGVGGVDAGVRAHEAVVRAADQHAVLGAQDLRGLVEHDLDRARVLALLCGQLPRSLAGLDVGEVDHGALGLRDDLVRDHDDLTSSGVASGGSACRAWTTAAARSSPARTSGRPAKGTAERLATIGSVSGGGRDDGSFLGRGAVEHRARAGGSEALCRRVARAAPRGRRRCRCPAAARPAARCARRTSAAMRERAVALAAAGAEAGRDRVGGCEQQAVGAGAVAVGHDHDLGVIACGRASASAVQLAGDRARGSRRGRTAPARIPSASARSMPRVTAALWPSPAVSSITSAPCARAASTPTARR